MTDVAYVTQEMWDNAQIDLRHAHDLLSVAAPDSDLSNEECQDWEDAKNEWLDVVKIYPRTTPAPNPQGEPK